MPINSPSVRRSGAPSRAPTYVKSVSDFGAPQKRGINANTNRPPMPRSTAAARAPFYSSTGMNAVARALPPIVAYRTARDIGYYLINATQEVPVVDQAFIDAANFGTYWNFDGTKEKSGDTYWDQAWAYAPDPPLKTGAIYKTDPNEWQVFSHLFHRVNSYAGWWRYTLTVNGSDVDVRKVIQPVEYISPTYPMNPFSPPAVNPDPFIAPAQNPSPRYRRVPSRRVANPNPNTTLTIDIGPTGISVTPGQNTRRPPRGTREIKIRSKAMDAMMFALNAVTELVDLIELFADASGLHKNHRLFKSVDYNPSVLDVLEALFIDGMIKNLDNEAFIRGFIYNEIEDRVVGRLNRAGVKNLRSTDQYGPTLSGYGLAT